MKRKWLVAAVLLISAVSSASAQTYWSSGYYGGPQYGSGGGDQYGYGPGYTYARQAPSLASPPLGAKPDSKQSHSDASRL